MKIRPKNRVKNELDMELFDIFNNSSGGLVAFSKWPKYRPFIKVLTRGVITTYHVPLAFISDKTNIKVPPTTEHTPREDTATELN